jgi:hypothetical protein
MKPKSIFQTALRYRRELLIVILAFMLEMSSLWQLEVVTICMLENRLYDLPFYISDLLKPYIPASEWNYFWRDFWYATNILGFVLVFVAWYSYQNTVKKFLGSNEKVNEWR